jgi:hypothetical protein
VGSELVRGKSGVYLYKIIIPDILRAEILRALNRMNINHLSLFPDLVGASQFCNLKAEVTDY